MKITRKTYCFILLIFLVQTTFAQQYWIRQPSPTTKSLTKCIFLDSLYGWATGDSGVVIHTTTGGISWTLQNSNSGPIPLNDVFFLNRRLGWATANDFLLGATFILKTTNSGDTWNSTIYPDSTVYLRSVFFTDSLTGFMGNLEGSILKTINGGLNWNSCTIDSGACYPYAMNKINFINAQTGYICGGASDLVGEILKTTNSGLSWRSFCVSLEPLYDIKFNNGKIISTGGDYEYGSITAESHNGSQWNYLSNGCFGIGQNLAFRTPAEVWVPLGFSRLWAVSNDSGLGANWRCIPAPDTTAIYAAQFISPTNGWAFGSGGAIYKYNSAIIGIINYQNSVPSSTELYQNYPNPFNPETQLSYKLLKSENVRLNVYDITGKIIKRVIDKYQQAGTFKIEYDASLLPSGIYFYQLTTKDFTVTKKMVLIK